VRWPGEARNRLDAAAAGSIIHRTMIDEVRMPGGAVAPNGAAGYAAERRA